MKRHTLQPLLEVFLDAETEQATWCPNDIVQGYVRLSAHSSKRDSFVDLHRIVLKFVAGDFVDEKKFRKKSQGDTNAMRTTDTPFFEIEKVLWGMGRNISSGMLRLLTNRQYKFPFAIQLPHINYPKSTGSSMDNDEDDQQKPPKHPQSRYKVYFALQAAMEAPLVIRSKPFHLQFSPLLLTKIQGDPPENEADIRTPDAKNVAKARVDLARQAYCPGDLITGHITIHNLTNSKLSRVKISFIQRTALINSSGSSSSSQSPTFADNTQDIVLIKSYVLNNGEKKKRGTVPKNSVLDNYAFELRIPLYTYHSLQLPSRKISISHFVRLSFSQQQCSFGNLLGKNPCRNNYNVDVPVTIGTVQHYMDAGDENLLSQMPDLESSLTAHQTAQNLGFEVRPYFGDLDTDIDSVAMAVGDKLRNPTLVKRSKKINRTNPNSECLAIKNNSAMSARKSSRDSEGSTTQTISSSSWPELSLDSEDFEDSPTMVANSGRMLLDDTDEEESGEDTAEVEYYKWEVNLTPPETSMTEVSRPLSLSQPTPVTCAQPYASETQYSQSLPLNLPPTRQSPYPYHIFYPPQQANHFPFACAIRSIPVPTPAPTYPDFPRQQLPSTTQERQYIHYSDIPQNSAPAASYTHPPSIPSYIHFQAPFHTESPAPSCPLQTNYNQRISAGYYHATTSTGQYQQDKETCAPAYRYLQSAQTNRTEAQYNQRKQP